MGVPRRAAKAVAAAGVVTKGRFSESDKGEKVRGLVFASVLVLLLAIALISIFLILLWAFLEGRTRLDLNLITQGPSSINRETAGFRTAILGTVQIISGVILIIVPLGVTSALYLEQFADRSKWWNRLIELNIQNLAGVPSIVFGILGLAFIVRGPLGWGFIAAAGSATVALLVLPTVILASREAIKAVPPSILEGSLALGTTRWQAVSKQVLPSAFSGILTGVILAISRAIGEAAPLLLVGAVTFVTFDPNFWEGGYSALPVLIYQYAGLPQKEFRIMAAAGVLVMLLLLILMNSVAIWLRARFEKAW